MDTLLIQLTNNRAYRLLQKLEELNLIKVLNKSAGMEDKTVPAITRKKVSDYKGILSSELVDKMQAYVKESREEWQQRI
jgi:hypothetical protein